MTKPKFRDVISFADAIKHLTSNSDFDTMRMSGERQKTVEFSDITHEMDDYVFIRDVFHATDKQIAVGLERIYKVKITEVPL